MRQQSVTRSIQSIRKEQQQCETRQVFFLQIHLENISSKSARVSGPLASNRTMNG